jgi:hypothetical protein
MRKYITADQDIDTKDIMYALTGSLPAAVESLDRLNLPEFDTPEQVAEFIQKNVQYQEDGLDFQLVQLPTALLSSGKGDCKSISLFLSAVLTKYGVKNGFRFVAFAPGDVTHVYNFYVDHNNNTVFLDACVPGLAESPNYIKKIDMQVGVIGSTPIVYKSGSKIGSRMGFVDRYYFAVPRQAFLALLKLNYRGYADVFNNIRANQATNPVPWLELTKFWIQTFAGQLENLNIAIDQGRGKIPLFGRGNAADQAYLADQYSRLQSELGLAEFVGTAVQAGYVLDPVFRDPRNGQPTVDWQLIFPGATNPPANWPQVLTALIQSIDAFFVGQGNIILQAQEDAQQGSVPSGPPVDITNLPTRPVVVAPGSGAPRGPIIGSLGGTEAVVAVMAAAAPILVALPNLLRSIGLESAADAVENVAGDIPQPPPGDNSLLPGANPPATLFGLPMPLALLLGIGAIFLLTNKKR